MHIRRIYPWKCPTPNPYPYPFKQGNYYPYPIGIRENCGYPQKSIRGYISAHLWSGVRVRGLGQHIAAEACTWRIYLATWTVMVNAGMHLDRICTTALYARTSMSTKLTHARRCGEHRVITPPPPANIWLGGTSMRCPTALCATYIVRLVCVCQRIRICLILFGHMDS